MQNNNKTSIMKNALLNVQESTIIAVLAAYPNMTVNGLSDLVKATDVKGCKFVSLNDYNSNKSDNTELANYVVNIGISYENMLNKDAMTINSYDVETIQTVLAANVAAHNYGKYNLSKFTTPATPAAEILALLPAALIALKQDTNEPATRTNNNIKLNPVLWFNTATNNLLLFGKKVSKTATVKGDFKPVTSAPMTVAKEIIRQTLRKDDLRTFIIDNVLTSLVSKGEILELA